MEPHEYLRFVWPEFHGKVLNVDADGTRRTWSPPPPARGTRPLIFVFGGSTVWGWGSPDDRTIPSDLARRLDAAGVPADVKNFGAPAYVSTQEVVRLELALQAGARPDVVIFLDGLNDAAVTYFESGLAGGTSMPIRRLERGLVNENFSPAACAWRCGLRASALWQVIQSLRRPKTRDPHPLERPAEAIAGDVVRVYAANVSIVEALGAKFGFRPLLYWQPTIATKKTLSDVERRLSPIYPGLLGPLKPVLLQSREKLRRGFSSDPSLRDLSSLFDDRPQTVYTDCEHYTEAASDEIAARLAADVAPLLRRGPRRKL